MGVKERINEYILYKNIPISEFEKICGLSNGYISSMRKGFGVSKLNNVLKEFPDLNREWLLYGEGKMFKQTNELLQSDEPTEGCECPMNDLIKSVLENSQAVTEAMKNIVESNTHLVKQQTELIATIRALAEK